MATLLTSSPLRVRLSIKAHTLLQDSFVCRRCIHQSIPKSAYQSLRQTPFLRAFRQPHLRVQSRAQTTSPSATASPLGALSHRITASAPKHAPTTSSNAASSWPEVSSKSAAYWLLASAASVFGIVIFGGLTRLTESGLSITEWRPVTGSFPPLNQEIWEEEFARYKLSPEFKMLNSRMNLDEFKQIYWMEWTHRLWGRVVGITFLVPTVYFIVRRKVSASMALRLTGICGMIGFQGFIGWWMVKSGLKDDLLETGSHPRVSQYRLATHLGTAFLVYLSMLYNGLQILRQHRVLANPAAASEQIAALQNPALLPFRRSVAALALLVFATAMSGALVAGLDAGLVYNDFPWMGHPNFIPPKREMLDPFYSHTPSQTDLIWRNMFENPVLAQLDHRVLATTTFTAVMALWAYTSFNPAVRRLLPHRAKRGVLSVVSHVAMQVVLGITTLWYLVPVPLAAAHQGMALLVLTSVVVLGGRVWVPQRTVKLVKKALEQAQSAGQNGMVGRRGPDAMMKARLEGAAGVGSKL